MLTPSDLQNRRIWIPPASRQNDTSASFQNSLRPVSHLFHTHICIYPIDSPETNTSLSLPPVHSLTPHPEIPLTSSSATPGTPHTLILTSSAIRATHVIRALRTLQTSKDIVIAKLFAKHIKLSDSIALCNSTRINIGVGTPARMLELMREGALKLDGCVRLVLDMSAVNEKKQGLLDVRETQKAVVEFVNEPGVKERLSDGEMRVLVF